MATKTTEPPVVGTEHDQHEEHLANHSSTLFRDVAISRKDPLASEMKANETMTISGCGLQGSGKTSFCLVTMPTPILHLNFDRDSTHLFYQKDGKGDLLIPKERQQDIAVIQLGPEKFNPELRTWDELTAQYAQDEMTKALNDYVPAMDGGTIFLDGGSVFNNLVQFTKLAEIKRTRDAQNKKLFPFDYAAVNTEVNGLLGKLDRAPVNFYMTQHLTEVWGSDGPIPGAYKPQQNSQVPKAIQVELWFWCVCAHELKSGEVKRPCGQVECQVPGHEGRSFQLRIVQNKLNKAVEGRSLVGPLANFDGVYRTTYGGRGYREEVA